MGKKTQAIINERRHKLWLLLVKGLKSYDVAVELSAIILLLPEISNH